MKSEKILEEQQTFYPTDENQHFHFPFVVCKHYRKLRVVYNYYPKQYNDEKESIRLIIECLNKVGIPCNNVDEARLELPLNNHLTISVDSPSGPVGNAHRHSSNMTITIGNSSTYGFLPTEIEVGEWKATISTHCILSESIVVNIIIFGIL
ncbi:MAG: hypothetical protein LBU04_04525 [Christensenellaceae bacterium]|jgi:hypothetical protein|nr:hypothetical protein [Christensenellaceae bacterium]